MTNTDYNAVGQGLRKSEYPEGFRTYPRTHLERQRDHEIQKEFIAEIPKRRSSRFPDSGGVVLASLPQNQLLQCLVVCPYPASPGQLHGHISDNWSLPRCRLSCTVTVHSFNRSQYR